jgi:hypothetical protein
LHEGTSFFASEGASGFDEVLQVGMEGHCVKA